MPREARIAANDAAAMPFPREETTPPVTNTNLVMGDKFWKFTFYIRRSSGTNRAVNWMRLPQRAQGVRGCDLVPEARARHRLMAFAGYPLPRCAQPSLPAAP